MSLLAGTLLAAAPASATPPSSAYTVSELPVALSADSVAADNDTDMVYAATNDGIAVINGEYNIVGTTINVPAGAVAPVVAVDPPSNTVIAIGYPASGPTAYVIKGATLDTAASILRTITLPMGLEAGSIAVDTMTGLVYVADDQDASIVVIDPSVDSVAATIPLTDQTLAPNPSIGGIAVDSATNTIYVTDNGDNQLAVIGGATRTVTSRIPLPAGSLPQGIVVAGAHLVYVADQGAGDISAVDTAATPPSVSILASGLTQPQGMALGTGGDNALYVTSAVNSSLTNLGTTYVIDAASGAVADAIPRGGSSVATFVDTAYVVGSGSGSPLDGDLTIMEPSSATANTMSPVLLQSADFNFLVGQPVSVQLTASAAPAAMFSATGLPDGLTLSTAGLLSGTPTTGGDFYPVVTATNSVAPSDSRTIPTFVDQVPVITSADKVTFTAGVARNFQVNAFGFPPPTLSETGTLPAGVSFTSTGELAGTPAANAVGSYPIQIKATNLAGTATQAFKLTVVAAINGTATYQNPAITWTGNAVLITAADSNGNIDYWWQAAGTGVWHRQQVAAASGTVTYQNPAITWTGNAVLITAADSAGNLDYWWQAAGTGVWHQQQVAAGGAVNYENPAITWTGNAVLITATDYKGNLDYWWQAVGTGIWHQQQVAAASSTVNYLNPAITWTGSAVLITAADSSSGNIDYWWQAAGTGAWHQQQVVVGGAVHYLNPAITWTGNTVLITAADSAGNIDYWWQGAGTGIWNPQQVAAAGTVTYQNPATIVWTGNAVLITATDMSGDLDYWWQAAGTGIWNPQQVASTGSGVRYLNPAITWTGNAVLITATDMSGNLDYWWQGAGTGIWNPQQVAAGA